MINGVMPDLQRRLDGRPVFDAVDTILRGVGQVVFMNNPVTGLAILVALLVAGPWLALGALLGVVVATGTAVVLGLDRDTRRAGLFGFNGTLTGAGLTTFLSGPPVVVLVAVVVVAAASTVAMVAVSALLLPTVGLPALTLPFNLVTLGALLAAYGMRVVEPAVPDPPAMPLARRRTPEILLAPEPLDVVALGGGVLRGVGQVFLAESAAAGVVILVGIAVCSRIAALAASSGSVVGLLTGLAIGAPRADLEAGLWGYNAVLCAMAVGGVFVVLTWRSALLAVACAVGGSLALPAFTTLLAPAGVPPLTLPFVVVTLALLLVASAGRWFATVAPADVTTPEGHRRAPVARRSS